MKLNTLALVHEVLSRHVQPGAFCIDATAGKGRDTALLCRLAGPEGTVLSFDIQSDAVRQTRELLTQEGLSARVYQESHVNMGNFAKENSVDAIVFNFGRLPGGDPHIFTHAETSIAAINAGLALLKPGGLMAIALYYGKENGYAERDAILTHVRTLDDRAFSVLSCDWANRKNDPPCPCSSGRGNSAPVLHILYTFVHFLAISPLFFLEELHI